MSGKAIIKQIEDQIEALEQVNSDIGSSESMDDILKLFAMKTEFLRQHIRTLLLLRDVYKELKNI